MVSNFVIPKDQKKVTDCRIEQQIGIVDLFRKKERFTVKQPFTPISLLPVNNLNKNNNIGVLFTVEWAIYLKHLGYTNLSVITLESDPYIQKICSLWKFNYIILNNHKGIMKFDTIIGNPPYNKNLITKNHPVYNHPAMNSEKEGYIGFFIQSLELLKPNGKLIFLTPGKFMMGAGTKNFREWVSKNYDLVSIEAKNPSIFETVGLDSLVVTTIINKPYSGITRVTDINQKSVIMDYTKNKDYIIPNLGDQQLFDDYNKVTDFVINWTCHTVGDYGPKFKSNFSDIQTTVHTHPVCMKIENNLPVITYTNLQSNHQSVNQWRVITNLSFSNDFAVLPPGIELAYNKYGIAFNSEQEARDFYNWTQTDKWKKLWAGLNSTRHTHVVIRNMPKYPI